MLNLLAISAVFLTVLQAPFPTPRQATNPSTSRSEYEYEHRKSDNGPSEFIAMLDQPQPSSANGYGQEHGGKDQGESVSITKIPSVSVTKDWTDRIYWAFSGLLVIVGGLQLYFLWGTLVAVKTQASHMAIQAGHMESQLSLMKDAERAWLLVEGVNIPDDPIEELILGDVDNFPESIDLAGAEFRMVNYGKTPATVTNIRGRFEIGHSRERPPHPEQVFDKNSAPFIESGAKTLKPGEEHVIPQNGKREDIIRLELIFWTSEKIRRIINDADFLWAYGLVVYRDVCGREHETRFCYRYVVPPEETEASPHLCLRGPSEYNKCT